MSQPTRVRRPPFEGDFVVGDEALERVEKRARADGEYGSRVRASGLVVS